VPWSSTSLSRKEYRMIRPLTPFLMALLSAAMYFMNGLAE